MKKKGSMGRLPKMMEVEIIQAAIKDKTKPREELAHELRRKFGARSPTPKTLMRKISKARNHTSVLDYPWSIGCCAYYDIPNELIGVLIDYQKHLDKFGGFTIRVARWISKIYHVAAPLLENKFPGKTLPNKNRLLLIAEAYAREELLNELTGEPLNQVDEAKSKPYDSKELDKRFFILQDVSTETLVRDSLKADIKDWKTFEKMHPQVEQWLEQGGKDNYLKMLQAEYVKIMTENFEPIFGKLDIKQLTIISDYLLAHQEGKLKGQEWEHEHPDSYLWIQDNAWKKRSPEAYQWIKENVEEDQRFEVYHWMNEQLYKQDNTNKDGNHER
jgi:hypothetical protein